MEETIVTIIIHSDPLSITERKRLSLPANRKFFIVLRDWLVGIADALEISAKDRKEILVAADEIFTNISCYAYPSAVGTVEISIRYEPQAACLSLTFSDYGVPFNPLEKPEPDTAGPIEERPIGGLGIHLVRRFMDSVEYRRENGRNFLVLKKFPAREENP